MNEILEMVQSIKMLSELELSDSTADNQRHKAIVRILVYLNFLFADKKAFDLAFNKKQV